MKAGDLYESVAFDAPTSAPDGYGGTESGWSESLACRAHFRWLRGGEGVMAGRLEGRQPVVVTIRSSTLARAVTTGYRMRDVRTGAVYNVRSATPMQDSRQWIEVLCEGGVAT